MRAEGSVPNGEDPGRRRRRRSKKRRGEGDDDEEEEGAGSRERRRRRKERERRGRTKSGERGEGDVRGFFKRLHVPNVGRRLKKIRCEVGNLVQLVCGLASFNDDLQSLRSLKGFRALPAPLRAF